MFWKELVTWVTLFLKWEGAVVQWKMNGRSELFVMFAATGGVLLELAVILAVIEGGLRGVRLARVWLRSKGLLPKILGRVKLNGKGQRKLPHWLQSIISWLKDRELDVAARYSLILLFAALPMVPYITYGAIALSKVTKSRYGYHFIVVGTIIKVFLTVRLIFHYL